MKKITKFSVMCLATLSLSMSSCLKDEFVDFSKVDAVAELPLAGFAATVLEASNTAQDVAVVVNIASPEVLGQAVTVNLQIDAAAVEAYNKANTTTFEVLPATAFTVPSTSVTIPAGQRRATFIIKVETSKIDLSKKFILPVSIKDAGSVIVSGNFRTSLLAIAVKNKYEASYQATGVFNHPTAGARNINEVKGLTTIDANTVAAKLGDLAGWTLWLTVNADNTVSMKHVAGGSLNAIPNGVNKYDPATKSFTLNYKYAGGGGDRVVSETLTRK